MTLREALREKKLKLKLPGWPPNKYVEINDSMFGGLWEQKAFLYDNGSKMPIKLWELAQHEDWVEA